MFDKTTVMRGGSLSEVEVNVHLRRTFNYMTGGVALSGLVAWFTLHSPAMMEMAMQGSTQWIFFAIWIGFGFFMHKILLNTSAQAALGIFIAFSALTGFALAPLMAIYTGASVATAFFTAAAAFGGASIYGYVKPESMAGAGKYVGMIALGLFAAIIINLFVQSSGLSFIISLAVVPLVTFATAMEVNMLRDTFNTAARTEHESASLSIYGAASLYMNFVVMFIHLLNILGQRR